MYFNQTPYGGTLWGVDAAARGIFNKNISDLDLAESALIAGLPGSPTRYSPFAHPDAAKMRQELVIGRMEELGMISKEQKEVAIAEKLNYYVDQNNIQAPHFVFYVKEKLVEKFGLKRVNEGGLRITTTLDLDLQEYTQQTVASEVAKLAKSNVTNGAAMIIDPKTGQILTMVGSKDYFANDIEGKFNVATALRQPGSSIKPLNYAAGIETGKITAASVIYDGPTCFRVEGQKDYCPTNYGNKYFGIQNTRTALANSVNIPAVKVLKLNGVEAFVASASAMGISTFKDASNYGLSLTLGGGEVMMVDMAVAFGSLANQGLKQEVTSIIKIEDSKGNVLEEYGYIPGERVISKETTYIISQMLADDGARSMVFGAGSLLSIRNHPEVAVKTGTTNDLRDNWTIGYTPEYVTVVWVGNNDNTRMKGVVSGTSGAAPIWSKVMTKILKDKPAKVQPRPQEVVGINVCNLTGQLPPDGGCDVHYEYFKKEFVPTDRVPLRMNVLINKDNGQIVGAGETVPNTEWQEHGVVKDISGQMVCLDCPPIPDGVKIINYIN
jgi:membrane peptidoglycan carboxypeptidase